MHFCVSCFVFLFEGCKCKERCTAHPNWVKYHTHTQKYPHSYYMTLHPCAQLEKMKGQLETMKQEHAKQKVSDSSALARLQGQQEGMSEANKQTEVKFTNTKGIMRKRVTEFHWLHFFFLRPWPLITVFIPYAS